VKNFISRKRITPFVAIHTIEQVCSFMEKFFPHSLSFLLWKFVQTQSAHSHTNWWEIELAPSTDGKRAKVLWQEQTEIEISRPSVCAQLLAEDEEDRRS
jgi:hypothetical protein